MYWWFNQPKYPGLNYREYTRLAKLPAYQAGEVYFQGVKTYFIDAAGFLANVKELFNEGAYTFKTNHAAPFIVDCGAYIGLSIIFFKTLFPNAKILAFEADPAVFAILQKNLAQRGYTNVTLINAAVWIENGEVRFHSNPNMTSSLLEAVGDAREIVTVPAIRLKEVLAREQVDMLKLDVEGAEKAILEDCRTELQQVGNLFVEYHGLAGQPQGLSNILALLQEAGFRYYVQDANDYAKRPLLGLAKRGFDLQLNVFGLRPGLQNG